jgi:hypothetical protein
MTKQEGIKEKESMSFWGFNFLLDGSIYIPHERNSFLLQSYLPDCCLENSKYSFCRKSSTRRLLKYST